MSLIQYRPGGGSGVVGTSKGATNIGPQGPQGPSGPGVAPLYASFQSNSIQYASVTDPTLITLDERTIGTLTVSGGTYPNSEVVIPTAGTYKIVFSAQCDSASGNHYLEIFPAINGTPVPRSNTRIKLQGTNESCLTVEYFLSFGANDKLTFYMVSDSTNARLLAITVGTGTPTIPNIPSFIVTIMRIE